MKGGELTMNDFLPEGTKIPSASDDYMKLSEPENRFRVLGSAIVGFELWVNGKPIRNHMKDQFMYEDLSNADISTYTGKKKLPQYFWAFPVYDYKDQRIKILEITQKSIQRDIMNYLNDPDFGDDPTQYDFVIVRTEVDKKVTYSVKGKPPKPLDEGIKETYEQMHINLDALYEGGNPFEEKTGEEIALDAVKAGL